MLGESVPNWPCTVTVIVPLEVVPLSGDEKPPVPPPRAVAV